MKKKSFAKNLILAIMMCLAMVIGIVVLLDPYYHYHGPLPGFKAVLAEPEYQVIGSIRNFNYDSIIVGSSVAENFDTSWFDEGFDCKTIKGIKKSGTTAYLLYFVDEAYKSHELKYVFYSLDVSALLADYDMNIEEDGLPVYLFDNNPVNDVNYIFNKDVIFEKIPYMLAMSFSSDYKEGEAYSWAKYKTFSEDIARSNYVEPERHVLTDEEIATYEKNIEINISEIEKRVANHPETRYIFWIPPYSVLWREQVDIKGEMEVTYKAIKMAEERLSSYNNVSFYSFIDDREVTDNLDNYMDTVHFSKEINYYIYENICR